ncbi:hypothetical protein WKY82_08430 [Gordonia malaquae]|uniref:hypothetical protein n=1 Tax=Gordonia malaquae TaxID=410332 RepID=UPI0030C79510
MPVTGDGSMRVGEDGGLVDPADNPVKNADGIVATAAWFLGGDGSLTDGSGGEIIGASGSPLTADDVTDFGPGERRGRPGRHPASVQRIVELEPRAHGARVDGRIRQQRWQPGQQLQFGHGRPAEEAEAGLAAGHHRHDDAHRERHAAQAGNGGD